MSQIHKSRPTQRGPLTPAAGQAAPQTAAPQTDAPKGGTAADLGGVLTLEEAGIARHGGLGDRFTSDTQRPGARASGGRDETPAGQAARAAVEKFQGRLLDIFGVAGPGGPSAAQLARQAGGAGGPPSAQPGGAGKDGAVTPAQRAALQEASIDLLKEMPLSALSPSAAARARSLLESRGIDTAGFDQKTLGQLGPVGEELARSYAAELKSAAPGAYYGLAAAGAAAVGAYGYVQGSDALKRLGIKPEVRTSLFNDQVKARATASWGQQFSDPNLQLAADGTFRVSKTAQLRVGASARGGASGITGGIASVTYRGERAQAGVSAHLGTESRLSRGLQGRRPPDALGYTVSGQVRTGVGLQVDGAATFDRSFAFDRGHLGVEGTLRGTALDGVALQMRGEFADGGRLDTLRASASYQREPWKLSADIAHQTASQRTTGSLSVGYQPSRDLDFQIRGSLDSRGESRIGAGLTWRF